MLFKIGDDRELARRIQEDIQCDILKIEPEDPYGNYFSSLVRVNKERKNNVPVRSVTEIPDLSGYDTVFIGYPIWYLDVPAFVADFIGRCNLEGKTVIPFATCGLANISTTLNTIKRVCPESKVVHPFNYGVAKKDNYEEWILAIR
ncbi:flavodoxin [Caproiciproducens sp.]